MSRQKVNHQWERVKGTKEKPKYKVSNLKFSQEDKTFIQLCENAGVKPTQRQASKFRNKKGSAWMKRNT